ncbi:MAG: insulinase family protein [Treponema sp.]|nr:insulinase family protein [Treponema sp.]
MKKNHFLKSVLVFTTVLALGCFTSCASAKKSSFKEDTPLVMDTSIKQGQLENGMKYFVQKNGEPKNRIVLRLVVNAGSCMEEEDQKGVAHFVEHLAFNGTEHFEKSAIVDYFEKIGMNFGADLNAYTSFEETVYKLEIPADDPKMLETALLILKDWACGITFLEEEIEKERGVVTEEWRLRQGLQGRISDKQIPFLLADSRFEERLPIGSMDIIANVSRDRILDFYKKWYRPEIMSVIVVGDAEEDVLEAAVKNVMEEIPASEEKISVSPFTVPYNPKKDILIIQDPEQKYSVVNILEQDQDYHARETVGEMRKLYAADIAASIINQRLDEITNTPDAAWLAAAVGEMSYTNLTHHYYLGVVPKEGMFTEALEKLFDEYDRILNYGVTEAELKRMKENFINSAEMAYANKDKNTSDYRASLIINYVTTYRKKPVGDDDYQNMVMKFLPEITVQEVNDVIRNLFPERGSKFLALAPDSVTDIPSESEIMNLWENYTNTEVAAYAEDDGDDSLMDRPKGKGKVVSKKDLPELGAKKYVFENGITVITKNTDFQKEKILVEVTSKGGSAYVSDEDYPSSRLAVNYAALSGVNGMTYNQVIKKLTAKQLNLGVDIYSVNELFNGSCRTTDLESCLQLLTLFMTKPQFDKEAWNTLIQSEKEIAKNHGVQPNDVLNDKINEILFNDIRHAPYDLDFISKMTPEQAENVYRERFANPADFTYIFVGDFDEKKLIDECAVYLGTLKTTSDREETKYIYYDFPEGKPSATVKKGLDNQGYDYICIGSELPVSSGVEESFYDSMMMSQLSGLLDIRLREVIREDKGGAYGVYVGGYIDGYPERFYRVEVSFGCEPGRCQELTDEVIKEFDRLKTELVSEDYIQKLQETYRRNHERNLRENSWWMEKIRSTEVYTYEPLWMLSDVEKVVSWITAENLRDTARKYLNTDNYVSVFLVPEK